MRPFDYYVVSYSGSSAWTHDNFNDRLFQHLEQGWRPAGPLNVISHDEDRLTMSMLMKRYTEEYEQEMQDLAIPLLDIDDPRKA